MTETDRDRNKASSNLLGFPGAFRELAGDLSNQAMDAMEAIPGQKHERAFPGNKRNLMLTAEVDGVGVDRAIASGTVHPDPPYTGLGAIGNHSLGDGLGCHEQCSVNGRLDVLHAGEAAMTEYLGRLWMHRNHVISAPTEFLKKVDAEMLGIARDANHSDALLCQKIFDDFERGRLGRHDPS